MCWQQPAAAERKQTKTTLPCALVGYHFVISFCFPLPADIPTAKMPTTEWVHENCVSNKNGSNVECVDVSNGTVVMVTHSHPAGCEAQKENHKNSHMNTVCVCKTINTFMVTSFKHTHTHSHEPTPRSDNAGRQRV